MFVWERGGLSSWSRLYSVLYGVQVSPLRTDTGSIGFCLTHGKSHVLTGPIGTKFAVSLQAEGCFLE